MCMKEAVTNVVKHSQATHCQITIEQSIKKYVLLSRTMVSVFRKNKKLSETEADLLGMKERWNL